MRIGLALAVTAAALALGAHARAAPLACAAVFDFVGAPTPGGERRAVVRRPKDTSERYGVVTVMFVTQPKDDVAAAFRGAIQEATAEMTPFEIASRLSECFEVKDEIDSDVVERDGFFRAEHVDPRRGLRVLIEASDRACRGTSFGETTEAPCLLIEARRP
jgi:hypothetical protein